VLIGHRSYRDIGTTWSPTCAFSALSILFLRERFAVPHTLQRIRSTILSLCGIPTATWNSAPGSAEGVGWIGPYIVEPSDVALVVQLRPDASRLLRKPPTGGRDHRRARGGKTTLAMLML